ncbi:MULTISPECIES: DUSAM domain-containing protein [Corallococcus]|uniref:DUSAM domain-containing protein n=1 Tax=Corallococcus TaxID=83461 RepID=UPI000EE789F2|nr:MULTISPECIES: DUSAM domain-containing protein [Corallococcus]NPD28137.1 DUSAM domain-containing protein [Corallococcus exiguus]NRD49823.1 DUSAM domain-containing protein [Corallococcus exiguus]RKH95010.1 DUSAM domain-containing protein [Corallococcus sp. AB038B]
MTEDIDWDPVRELASRVEAGEALVLTPQVRDLLLRTAQQVAIPESDAQAAIQDVATATALLREARGRIREGSIRLNITEMKARDLVRAGDKAGARQLLGELLAVESVPLYREQIELALEDLD